jgi:protein SCO1
MRFKFNYYWLLLLIPVIFISWFLVSQKEDKPTWLLPYFGPKNAAKTNDTIYHKVQDFEFISQFNETVTQETVGGKIYVAEYFFTTCQSICPVMNNNLERVYGEFKNEPDVLILSHTVDPETDSVRILMNYANAHGVKDKKWLFLIGKKKDLYEVARTGYLLDAQQGDGGDEDFIHTQNFALIDKERRIRGFYDGTDSLEVNRLIREIKVLLKEYDYKEKSGS